MLIVLSTIAVADESLLLGQQLLALENGEDVPGPKGKIMLRVLHDRDTDTDVSTGPLWIIPSGVARKEFGAAPLGAMGSRQRLIAKSERDAAPDDDGPVLWLFDGDEAKGRIWLRCCILANNIDDRSCNFREIR